jgi:hypothetical protein
MPKGILIVQSQPSDPSCEDAYNEWYSRTHIPEVCAVPGFVGARRYRVREAGRLKVDPTAPRYIAVYELEADDLEATVRELSAHSADGRISKSDVIEMDPRPVVTLYELVE